MKRDHDLSREILQEFEASESWSFTEDDGIFPQQEKRYYHILLLCDEGLMVKHGQWEFRLTAAGHSFVEATRNNGVWEKTKKGADAIGGVTLLIMKDIAVAYVRQIATEKLGINLS